MIEKTRLDNEEVGEQGDAVGSQNCDVINDIARETIASINPEKEKEKAKLMYFTRKRHGQRKWNQPSTP